jgi:hypothetical protein
MAGAHSAAAAENRPPGLVAVPASDQHKSTAELLTIQTTEGDKIAER